MLKRLLHQLRFVENEIDLLDQRLEQLGQRNSALAAAVARWVTVPGVDRVAAWSLAATAFAEVRRGQPGSDFSGTRVLKLDGPNSNSRWRTMEASKALM